MTCSNYYLSVLTWNLSTIHPAVGLQDIWLPINYNGTPILIFYHEIQIYLCFIKLYNFFYNIFTGYYYNRSQQFYCVSSNSRQASIYHVVRSHNQCVNHIVLFMLRYNTCTSIIYKHNYVIRTILLFITQSLLSHVIRCRILIFLRDAHQGWGQVQYLYLVLVLRYIFIST